MAKAKSSPGVILCATRGGDVSVRAQEAAIRQAAESSSEIVFFYVVDVEFLSHAKFTLRSDVVHEELEEMAEFLLAMAVERAEKKHVRARSLIRHGNFSEELVSAAQEMGATLVVLGCPADDKAAFKLHHLQDMAAELQAQTGIPFAILPEQDS